MSTIESAWPHIEIYSIDEAFLDLSTLAFELHESFCVQLQKRILKETGIPTSIGIGKTKTLAKLANFLCKKALKIPVFNVTAQQDYWLAQMAVGDVWGIGRRWSKKLESYDIKTAYDLSKVNVHVLKKQFNVIMMRTAMELSGIACGGLVEPEHKQSILSSKSFGQMQTEFSSIAQSLSSHCARAVDKLRMQKLLTQRMSVFVRTNKHREDLAQHFQSFEVRFINPTDDLRIIIKHAKNCLRRIYKAGYHYKKIGICLEDLMPHDLCQLDIFHQPSTAALKEKEQFMRIMEQINQRFGKQTLRLAAEGYSKPWAMRCELKSPAYTTRWSDLPKVNISS